MKERADSTDESRTSFEEMTAEALAAVTGGCRRSDGGFTRKSHRHQCVRRSERETMTTRSESCGSSIVVIVRSRCSPLT